MSKLKWKDTKQCDHTPQPEDYLQWHDWAEHMAKTHDQRECPHCGKWAIWVEKAQP